MIQLRPHWMTALFVFCSFVASASTACAQVELALAASPPFSTTNKIVDEILACEDSAKLLAILEELVEWGRNPQSAARAGPDRARALSILTSNNGNLPWTTLPLTGWRWESSTAKNGKIILAIEGPLAVAIYESSRSTIDMSVRDYSEGKAVQRGYAGTPRYFAHQSSSLQHISAMSVTHFSNKSPEMFKLYYYFAGPTRDIVNSEALPRPVWLPHWAK